MQVSRILHSALHNKQNERSGPPAPGKMREDAGRVGGSRPHPASVKLRLTPPRQLQQQLHGGHQRRVVFAGRPQPALRGNVNSLCALRAPREILFPPQASRPRNTQYFSEILSISHTSLLHNNTECGPDMAVISTRKCTLSLPHATLSVCEPHVHCAVHGATALALALAQCMEKRKNPPDS